MKGGCLFPMTSSRTVTCILNGAAGSCEAEEASKALGRVFAERGTSVRIVLPAAGEDLAAHARRAVDERQPLVVAGGGDGTIGAVAGALVGSDTVLGILPLGTLNHFAKDLNIPLHLDGALNTLLAGREMCVDVGEVNGRVFLNNSGLGLYPRLVREREAQQSRGWSKWPAFLHALWVVFWRHKRLRLRLRLDGGDEVVYRTPFVFVGNNAYIIEGLDMGTRLRLDAGRLCVYTAHRAGRAALVRLVFQALLGHLPPGALDAMEAVEFCVQTRKRHLSVSTDGEVHLMPTPLQYRILPKALRVMVPAERSSEGVA